MFYKNFRSEVLGVRSVYVYLGVSMFLIIFHHVKQEEKIRSQVMVFLDEDDVSSEIFCYCEMMEDPV